LNQNAPIQPMRCISAPPFSGPKPFIDQFPLPSLRRFQRPMAPANLPSYASKLTTNLSPQGLNSPLALQQQSLPISTKICPFFLQNSCRYASHCRYRHDFGSCCPQCGEDVPLGEASQERHITECTEAIQLSDERRISSVLKCEICFENIVQSGRRFGLLQVHKIFENLVIVVDLR
jgi:hypothetical protein